VYNGGILSLSQRIIPMPKQKIVLASNNAGKVTEINQLLREHALDIVPQKDFNISDADETGLTFVENAIIKARHACKLSGLPAIADDSGLEVDALNGAPGIYSARYAGEHGNDQSNNIKLLDALKDIPTEQRGARFQCVMVYMQHENDPTPIICQGSWEGSIRTQAQGDNGFGYDPLFYVPEHNCSSAELSSEAKNALSHRGKALACLTKKLQSLINH